jgi:anti-anti-sigma regulatory factor
VEAVQAADGMVVRVKGEAREEWAGALLDGLLSAGPRSQAVALDLSELRSVSSAALNVLTAYGRSVARAGGQVRLAAGLQPAACEMFETNPNRPISPAFLSAINST